VDVAIPRPRRSVDGARLVVDTRTPSSGVTRYRNIPITNPTWTIVSLAERYGPGSLTRIMREASNQKILDMKALHRIAESSDRRPGIPTLRAALDLRTAGSSGYASRLERDVNRYLRTFEVPRFLPNVVVRGVLDDYEVDVVWHEQRICLEIDGPIHDDPDVQREDRDRTADLVAAGWTVIRIHWTAWEADRAAAVQPLIDALTLAS
jgi:very-short-patch-repair endonuclease